MIKTCSTCYFWNKKYANWAMCPDGECYKNEAMVLQKKVDDTCEDWESVERNGLIA